MKFSRETKTLLTITFDYFFANHFRQLHDFAFQKFLFDQKQNNSKNERFDIYIDSEIQQINFDAAIV